MNMAATFYVELKCAIVNQQKSWLPIWITSNANGLVEEKGDVHLESSRKVAFAAESDGE